MNFKSSSCTLFYYVASTRAHGDHPHEPDSGDAVQYAQRHIQSFDLPNFFQLHDLNSDGEWDAEEVEAIYGVHHVYSQRKSNVKDEEEHQQKAKLIVNTVFEAINKDKDGKISLEKLEAVGLDALLSFENLGAEGHHYDRVESEFFLHHEGTSHMKDRVTYQSLTHSLTIRLFRTIPQHAGNPGSIGLAAFQGISVEEAVAQRVGPSLSSDDRHPPDGAKIDKQEVPKKFERQTPLKQQDPALRFSRAKSESAAHGQWGAGEAGYKPPTTPGERMRK